MTHVEYRPFTVPIRVFNILYPDDYKFTLTLVEVRFPGNLSIEVVGELAEADSKRLVIDALSEGSNSQPYHLERAGVNSCIVRVPLLGFKTLEAWTLHDSARYDNAPRNEQFKGLIPEWYVFRGQLFRRRDGKMVFQQWKYVAWPPVIYNAYRPDPF